MAKTNFAAGSSNVEYGIVDKAKKKQKIQRK